MNALFFLFLIWLPISSVFYSLVNPRDGEVTNVGKKILLWALTLPSIWFFELNKLAAKLLGKVSVFAKLASWFKK